MLTYAGKALGSWSAMWIFFELMRRACGSTAGSLTPAHDNTAINRSKSAHSLVMTTLRPTRAPILKSLIALYPTPHHTTQPQKRNQIQDLGSRIQNLGSRI